jgi:adhesin/invasin
MITKNSLLALVLSTTLVTSAISDSSLEDKAKNKLTDNLNQGISTLSSKISEGISSFAEEYFENMKYLDFDINAQDYLKPTFSIMSVSEISKIDAGTIFNQTSINTHDGDETINIGFGIRKLLNDNTLLLGASTFYDHQLTESHQRAGVGAEAITSIFDVRGNYYNALSARRTNSEGTIERALDGWDLRGDYHLPIEHDVNLFVSAFEFENPETISAYKETGNKLGMDAKLGNFVLEGGYMDDNQANDAYFGSIKYVVNFGADNQSTNTPKDGKTLTDVSDKLYQPVKRENKIRVVKIDASGVVVGGF